MSHGRSPVRSPRRNGAPELGGKKMGAQRKASPGRGGRRTIVTVVCSMLVFAMGLGQAVMPAANAGAPTLTMGQVDTGTGSDGGGSTARTASRTVAAAAAATVEGGHVSANLEG